MDEPIRNGVKLALNEKIKDASGDCDVQKHPVLAFWSSAELVVCKTIVECFAQYTNLLDRLDAKDLQKNGRAQLRHEINNLNKNHKNTADETIGELLSEIARNAKLLDNLDSEKLLALSQKVVFAKRICKSKSTTHTASLSELVLENEANSLVDFLAATDQIACRLNDDFKDIQKDKPLFLAGFIRAHQDGERRPDSLINALNPVFKYLEDSDVQELAQSALLLELEHIEDSDSPFPYNYQQPFGLSPEDLSKFEPRFRHSYFAARLAIAALMTSNNFANDSECCKTILKLFLLPHGQRGPILERRSAIACANASDFVKSVIAYYEETNICSGGKEAFYEHNLSSEYDSASQWRRTLGSEGAIAGAAQALLKGTVGDSKFVVNVMKTLREQGANYRDTVPIALTGKFGVYFDRLKDSVHQSNREVGEPTCKQGHDENLQDSATDQINIIQSICISVANNKSKKVIPANQIGFVYSNVGSIYFNAWPMWADLKDECNWTNDGPTDWKERTSDGHLHDDSAPKAHLWLYGSGFQKSVDEAIETAKKGANEQTLILGEGALYTRFILLIPKCRKTAKSKVLKDYPGDAAMKRVLHYIGRTESIQDLKIRSDLYEAIVLREPLSQTNNMF